MLNEAMQAAVAAVKQGIDIAFIPMGDDKQQDLKKVTDFDKDPANDRAYASACALFSASLVLESQFSVTLTPEEIYARAVAMGVVEKANAYIDSYEGLAKACGVTVAAFETFYIKDNSDIVLTLLKQNIPLVVFLGAPDMLNHVEAINGYVKGRDETLCALKDVGYQGDTHFSMTDLKTFHFNGDQRVYSTIDHGPLAGTQRKAYKIGYFRK